MSTEWRSGSPYSLGFIDLKTLKKEPVSKINTDKLKKEFEKGTPSEAYDAYMELSPFIHSMLEQENKKKELEQQELANKMNSLKQNQ